MKYWLNRIDRIYAKQPRGKDDDNDSYDASSADHWLNGQLLSLSHDRSVAAAVTYVQIAT
jgi:hypothetical protein